MFINQGQRTKSKNQKTKELKSKLNLRGRQNEQNRSREQASGRTRTTWNHASRGNERGGGQRSGDKSFPRRKCIYPSILPE